MLSHLTGGQAFIVQPVLTTRVARWMLSHLTGGQAFIVQRPTDVVAEAGRMAGVPRPSPQTDRVVAVIELLAGREAGATMTEIARALDVNQASCVHMLAALAASGFVVREPDRRYHVGPALVHPGRVAEARYSLLAAARPEMAALAAEFEVACFAFAPDRDHARLVHYAWPAGQPAPGVRLGETVPLTPPLGMVFVAWGAEAAFDAWLALAPGADADLAARLRVHRGAIRELGFVVETSAPPTQQSDLAQVLDDRASPYRDGQLHRLLAGHGAGEFLLTDLDDARDHSVSGIGAPIFDAAGQVVLSFNLVAFTGALSGPTISRIGAAARAAADLVTSAIGGTQPGPTR